LVVTDAKGTSDRTADSLGPWREERAAALKEVRKLALDLDSGPATNGPRSRGRWRRARWARPGQWTAVLVDAPPDHGKYHPIERLRGIRENSGGGALLDSAAAGRGYAAPRTHRGVPPQVRRCTTQDPKGIQRKGAHKRRLEKRLHSKPGLEKWAMEIPPPAPDQAST
jgi:hypothetical protein